VALKGGKEVGFFSPVWNADEVCEYLKIHPGTLYKLVKYHKFPAFKMGSDWRFNVEQIEQWARDKQEAAKNKPWPKR
jgi:excisionase family DNA binding protein